MSTYTPNDTKNKVKNDNTHIVNKKKTSISNANNLRDLTLKGTQPTVMMMMMMMMMATDDETSRPQ